MSNGPFPPLPRATRRARLAVALDPGLRDTLERGLSRLSLAVVPEAVDRLLTYLALLGRWNRIYNLTAVREPQEMVTRHLLDCLAVSPYLLGPRVLDVGSGAGLPAVPLAVMHPRWRFTALDSSLKKTRFITQVVVELRLTNLDVVHQRVETYRPEGNFDTVVSRAFASLADFVATSQPLCRPGGVLLAMKGVHPAEEIQALAAGHGGAEVIPLRVPGLEAARHLVRLVNRGRPVVFES